MQVGNRSFPASSAWQRSIDLSPRPETGRGNPDALIAQDAKPHLPKAGSNTVAGTSRTQGQSGRSAKGPSDRYLPTRPETQRGPVPIFSRGRNTPRSPACKGVRSYLKTPETVASATTPSAKPGRTRHRSTNPPNPQQTGHDDEDGKAVAPPQTRRFGATHSGTAVIERKPPIIRKLCILAQSPVSQDKTR